MTNTNHLNGSDIYNLIVSFAVFLDMFSKQNKKSFCSPYGSTMVLLSSYYNFYDRSGSQPPLGFRKGGLRRQMCHKRLVDEPIVLLESLQIVDRGLEAGSGNG